MACIVKFVAKIVDNTNFTKLTLLVLLHRRA